MGTGYKNTFGLLAGLASAAMVTAIRPINEADYDLPILKDHGRAYRKMRFRNVSWKAYPASRLRAYAGRKANNRRKSCA